MKHLHVIGIGAGNPDYITIQAINALNECDVFFVADKGAEKSDLAALRAEICARYIRDPDYRLVSFGFPSRTKPAATYEGAIGLCNEELEDTYERLIRDELPDEAHGGFLIWGDPSLYDSTLRLLARIAARGQVQFEYDVIPGISSVQALAAKHKVSLNSVGEAVEITTGRKLATSMPEAASVVVMLDTPGAFKNLADQDVTIYWGAYVGTEDEVLRAGKLSDVAGDIDRLRQEARARKGWIMDSYLLKKKPE